MIAAEQIFLHKDGGSSSLIWLDFPARPLIFLIHEFGSWRGFPDLWNGEAVGQPHPGTERGFAFLIERAKLGSMLGASFGGERPYRTDVTEFVGTDTKFPFWQFQDSYGRLLRLELPEMNVHIVSYP